jgi:hypothetical protein
MPGVGRNSWKEAMQKAKEKSNPQSLQGPNPMSSKTNFVDPNIRTAPPDRSPDEMPTKRLNYFNYGQPMKRYNEAASALPKKEFKEIIQEKAKDPDNKGAQALAPLLRFCGGKSKPYKK